VRKGVKVVHTIAENAFGELKVTHTHTYDIEGRLCSYIIYDESGGLVKEHCYEYYDLAKYKNVTRKVITTDDHGSFLSSSTFDLSGNLTNSNNTGQEFYYEYEYDDKGRVQTRTEYDSEGSPERRIVFSYDPSGNKIEERHEVRSYPNDRWIELIISDPDSDYDETKIEYSHSGTTTYKYDKDNRLSELSNGNVLIRYNKEDRGYVTATAYATDEAVYVRCERFDYNGDIIKSWGDPFDLASRTGIGSWAYKYFDDEPDLPDFIYSYDDDGNWIRRTVAVSEKIVGIIRRVILYFPDNYKKLIRAVEVEP
jgi:YD repeat-containing protein